MRILYVGTRREFWDHIASVEAKEQLTEVYPTTGIARFGNVLFIHVLTENGMRGQYADKVLFSRTAHLLPEYEILQERAQFLEAQAKERAAR